MREEILLHLPCRNNFILGTKRSNLARSLRIAHMSDFKYILAWTLFEALHTQDKRSQKLSMNTSSVSVPTRVSYAMYNNSPPLTPYFIEQTPKSVISGITISSTPKFSDLRLQWQTPFVRQQSISPICCWRYFCASASFLSIFPLHSVFINNLSLRMKSTAMYNFDWNCEALRGWRYSQNFTPFKFQSLVAYPISICGALYQTCLKS